MLEVQSQLEQVTANATSFLPAFSGFADGAIQRLIPPFLVRVELIVGAGERSVFFSSAWCLQKAVGVVAFFDVWCAIHRGDFTTSIGL